MQIKKRCIICGNEFIADRRTAKYCSEKNTVPTCDYILRTGMPRGCKVSECDKYKPRGEVKHKSMVIFDSLSEEERAIRNGQYEALSLRMDQYQIQKRHSKERK